ncbi:3-dehydroquinate synthase family protein [Proteinivorax tanatarense]|uniref:3-dehydroquinate synthase family protein n=1 Tax=Proteinivorax tanatarense TaxID=1260629 RepID=A0AAU7VQA4_9FIRM
MNKSKCFFGVNSWRDCGFQLQGTKGLIVIDKKVRDLHKHRVDKLLGVFSSVKEVIVDEVEKHKTLKYAELITQKALDFNLNRNDWVIGVGGGATLDLAGFFASIYKRGANLCYLPTTIIAQVDSSYGGKTAVNFQGYKNQLGSFYPANIIGIDTSLLSTLNNREVYNGLGEIIKYIMLEPKTFKDADIDITPLVNDESLDFEKIIPFCYQIKIKYVNDDYYDKEGKRIALNLGHTIGHAIEKQSEYPLGHGQAVAIGLHFSVYVAYSKGKLELDKVKYYYKLLKRIIPNVPYKNLTEYVTINLKQDKKVEREKVLFIYPVELGWEKEWIKNESLVHYWTKFAEVNGNVDYF